MSFFHAGKTTFINFLCSYFRGGSFDKPKIIVPGKYHSGTELESKNHSESNVQDKSKSQTNNWARYDYSHKEHGNVSVFDTPGLADTRGSGQDDINVNIFLDAAKNAMPLSTIVLVVNGSIARDTINIR